MNACAQILNFHFGSIFNLRYIVGFLSYKHDSKNKNDQQTLIISNLIIFFGARAFARARSFHQATPKMTFFHIFEACSNMSRNFCARKCAPIDAHAKTKHFSYLHRPHNFKTHASMTMQSFEKIFKNRPLPSTFEPP